MKTVLKFSLILNLSLLGLLILACVKLRRDADRSVQQEAMKREALPQTVASSAAPIVQQVAESNPFRWKQLLLSSDYRTFVANLRAAGCPEPTVQDIVRGNVQRAFSAKRAELYLNAADPGPWSLRAQEQLINSFLNQPKATTPATQTASSKFVTYDDSSSAEPVSEMQIRTVERAQTANSQTFAYGNPSGAESVSRTPLTVREVISNSRLSKAETYSMPLALQDVEPAALALNSEQVKKIDDVRRDFVQQIGGANQDPTDPTYQQKWQRAQPAADDELLVLMGYQAYSQYQIAAYQKWLEERELQRRKSLAKSQ